MCNHGHMDTQNSDGNMNHIKLLATLFIGIFIGYVLTSISATNEQSNSNLTLENTTSAVNQSQASVEFEHVHNQEHNEKQNRTETVQASDAIKKNSTVTHPKVTQAQSTAEQTLEYKYEQLKNSHQNSKNKIASLERQLGELDKSDISTEQMEALVVAPFKGYMGNFTGAKRDEIYDFHQEVDDVDWGYNMQNYISDFIVTHNNSNEITLVSALCKQQKCELLVLQHSDGAWDKIARDLRQQSWWQFSSTNASSGNYPGSENSIAIYIFLTA